MTIIQHSWHDLQYLPSLTVADAFQVIPTWWKRAAATRQRYQPMSDIKYGAHPREVLDLYRAAKPRGMLVYIHGGYWRSFSKLETSWVVDAFLEQGFSVALVNYPLCPDVSLAHIRTSVVAAFATLYRTILDDEEKQNIIVTGHSAGGHLAALHLATDWTDFQLPENPIAGVLSLSGVFDVGPLLNTSVNTDLRLTAATAKELNLLTVKPLSGAKLTLAVGALESDEFHRQSSDMAQAWSGLSPRLVSVPGANHYTIVDSLASRDGILHGLARDMLEAASVSHQD